MIAVVMTTILALSFLASQGPTAAVASNIDRKAKARQIAESALQMAIDYVKEDSDWRTDKSSGVWMTGAALDGGTFTLSGTDEDDGDLADDSSEPVTLSVVATYGGVTHRVSARVTPSVDESSSNRLLLVAGNGSSPSSVDLNRKALFESWGYVVTVIDDGDSVSVYNDAVAVNDVVYVSEEVSSGSVNTKLRDVTIGVVNDEAYLHDDLGFSTTNSGSADTTDSMDILVNSHPITSGLALGSLDFYSGTLGIRYVTGSLASGVTVLADRDGSGTNAVFMIADVGDTLHYGSAAGRRVMFPANDSLDVNNLNTDGLTIMQRSLAWAASATEPSSGEVPTLLALYEFDPVTVAPTLAARWRLDEVGAGAAGVLQALDDVVLSSGTLIDAYDSADGAYGGTNKELDVLVITNTTSSNNVSLNNATIYGSVKVGAGGDPSNVISLSNGGSITGTQSAQTTNAALPTYDEPTGFPTSLGDTNLNSGGTVTWSSDMHYGNLTVSNGTQINVTGDIDVKVAGDFTMDSGDIVLAAGASIRLWIGQRVDINNGSTVNNDTSRPADLELLQYGDSIDYDLDLNDGILVGSIHSADDIRIYSGSAIYGSVVAEDDITIYSGAIHIDLSTAPPAPLASYTPTIARDDSLLANDGAVNNGPVGGVVGQHGTAFEFDGSNDYIEIPHDDSYLMQAGTFSVWFKADTTSPSRQGLFCKDATNYETGGHFSVFLRGSYVEVRMQSTSASYYVRSSSGSIVAGQWYHIMFAWGEEGMVLYLNGVEVDTDPYTGGLGTTSGGIGNYEPIVLGSNAWGSGPLSATPLQDYFDGTMDDLRIFNERLSESQAVEIYNGAEEPSPFVSKAIISDTSGYGEALDLAVSETDEVTWADGGITFIGDTHATSLTPATKLHDAIEANGAFTVEMLISRASPGSTASPSRIVSYADSSSSHNFMFGQDGTKYEARIRDSSTGSNGVLSPEFLSTTDLSASGDIHVVLSYYDGGVSVYLDGELDENNTAGGVLNNWDDDHYLVLGGAFGGGSHWQGTIKRLAVYDGSFNAVQAKNVFNGSDPGDGVGGGGSTSVRWDEPD